MEISRESVWPSLILWVQAPHARDQPIVSLASMSAHACSYCFTCFSLVPITLLKWTVLPTFFIRIYASKLSDVHASLDIQESPNHFLQKVSFTN